MPGPRRESTNAARVQALTLYSKGAKPAEIEEVTGIKKATFKGILRRARDKGYYPGGPILDEHVASGSRTGRPKVVTEAIGETIVEILTQNSTTRMYSTQEIADVLAERMRNSPGTKAPSRISVWRFLRANGFRNVKLSAKPGLNKAQRMKRLEFAMLVRDWTIEDWKRVVWSDETSVVLGAVRGKRRVWRRVWEKDNLHCKFVRWKGNMSFMFWACYTWAERGPCYCWPVESAKMTARYKDLMDTYNKAHEEEDRKMWELQSGMRRMALKGVGGRKPVWRYTSKTGKQERKGKGGIDWIRYQQEVILPRFLPFMKRLRKKYGPIHIVQEDNASSHIARWNRQIWEEAGFEVMVWPPNSPDLNAIEPPWGVIKQSWRKRKMPKSRGELEKEWTKQWANFPQEKLQRFVERIQGNVQWVIRLAGRNDYTEGTVPPPLPPGEEEPGEIEWREWIAKTTEEQEAELRAEAVTRAAAKRGDVDAIREVVGGDEVPESDLLFLLGR